MRISPVSRTRAGCSSSAARNRGGPTIERRRHRHLPSGTPPIRSATFSNNTSSWAWLTHGATSSRSARRTAHSRVPPQWHLSRRAAVPDDIQSRYNHRLLDLSTRTGNPPHPPIGSPWSTVKDRRRRDARTVSARTHDAPTRPRRISARLNRTSAARADPVPRQRLRARRVRRPSLVCGSEVGSFLRMCVCAPKPAALVMVDLFYWRVRAMKKPLEQQPVLRGIGYSHSARARAG